MNSTAPEQSVVIRAAQVVPALVADQLAVVASELIRAVGADLAVMIDSLSGRGGRPSRTTW